MKYKLFFANLPENITEEQLREICLEYGTVGALHILTNEGKEKYPKRAHVTLQSNEPLEPILVRLNNCETNGRRITVNLAESRGHTVPLTGEQRAVLDQISQTLGEKASPAIRQIARLIKNCGIPFAQRVLDDTLQIAAEGGIWLSYFNRHRTPGGIYLMLARQRVSRKMQEIVFLSEKSKVKRAKQQAAAANVSPQPADPPDSSQETVPVEQLTPAAPFPAPTPAKPKPVTPQEQLAKLRLGHQEAQKLLADVKAGKISGSPMVAMKAVVDTKRAIDEFLRQYPDLA